MVGALEPGDLAELSAEAFGAFTGEAMELLDNDSVVVVFSKSIDKIRALPDDARRKVHGEALKAVFDTASSESTANTDGFAAVMAFLGCRHSGDDKCPSRIVDTTVTLVSGLTNAAQVGNAIQHYKPGTPHVTMCYNM